MHVLSFFRMAIVEDKREQDYVVNSEPQLIAEAIALPKPIWNLSPESVLCLKSIPLRQL